MHYAELCWPDVLRVHEQSRREKCCSALTSYSTCCLSWDLLQDFGQKQEIPSDRNDGEYCGVTKANLTRSPLCCRFDGSNGRAKLSE